MTGNPSLWHLKYFVNIWESFAKSLALTINPSEIFEQYLKFWQKL